MTTLSLSGVNAPDGELPRAGQSQGAVNQEDRKAWPLTLWEGLKDALKLQSHKRRQRAAEGKCAAAAVPSSTACAAFWKVNQRGFYRSFSTKHETTHFNSLPAPRFLGYHCYRQAQRGVTRMTHPTDKQHSMVAAKVSALQELSLPLELSRRIDDT